ncbi:MAG: VacJ family lipoprotein [Thiogranum sp.]|nr:VacJ family lipoprotein [Thiogranum sp.]
MMLVALLAGCSTAPKLEGPVVPAELPAAEYIDPDVIYAVQEVYDPWEGFNRRVYKFNYRFDRYLFLPAVRAYKFVTPDFVEDGVHNFFMNVSEITNFINSVLQARPKSAGITLSRFAINSTVGILGLFDPATRWGIERLPEDFGQTLGRWGVGNGPYLVLPIFGPSNLRDTTGLFTDSAVLYTALDPFNFDEHPDREAVYYLFKGLDTRSHVPFEYYDTGSPFEYEYVRFLVTKKREFDIEK